MALGIRSCSSFKGFRDVSVFNKEILDTARYISFDEMDQNSRFIAYLFQLVYVNKKRNYV